MPLKCLFNGHQEGISYGCKKTHRLHIHRSLWENHSLPSPLYKLSWWVYGLGHLSCKYEKEGLTRLCSLMTEWGISQSVRSFKPTPTTQKKKKREMAVAEASEENFIDHLSYRLNSRPEYSRAYRYQAWWWWCQKGEVKVGCKAAYRRAAATGYVIASMRSGSLICQSLPDFKKWHLSLEIFLHFSSFYVHKLTIISCNGILNPPLILPVWKAGRYNDCECFHLNCFFDSPVGMALRVF